MPPTLPRPGARRSPSRPSRMRGGTMLGLILGLIVGLAAALVVAVYIAKVPIPFVTNAPVSNNGQNAAEDQRNQNWNPNATLQTHGPAQPASDAGSAPQPSPPLSQPQQPRQQPPVAVPPPVEVGQQPAPPPPAAGDFPVAPQTAPKPGASAQPGNGGTASDDVLGDFAAAHVHEADKRTSNASPATDAAFTYFVQTGAFRAAEDADAERARLSLLGMQATVTERDQAGRPVYRVRVGPLQNKTAADQVKDRLTNSGFEPALVRVPR